MTIHFTMGKFGFDMMSRNHRTFPINVNMYGVKAKSKLTDDQEKITLIMNRRNSFKLKPKKWPKLQKKVVLLLVFTSICGLIIFAYTDVFFRRKIFSVFLSGRTSNLPRMDNKYTKHLDHDQADEVLLPVLASTHYLLNYSSRFKDFNSQPKDISSEYNIFVIYTKENYHLHMKFDLFTHSLLKHTNARLHIHIITDKSSEASVLEILQRQIRRFRRTVIYTMYDVRVCSKIIKDIATKLSPYFNSAPTSYYSDSIFFLSLGLHRIADSSLQRAILLDCDIVFRSDIRLLFAEFDSFQQHHLFGLAPELTPVYRHILYRYRVRFPKTSFGNPYYPMPASKSKLRMLSGQSNHFHVRHGYPGLNSGVVLLFLNRIRNSKVYSEKLSQFEVQRLVDKYSFKGHLGDQDFFTLLGYEYPNLIYRLDCVWNRQLCTWWKDHGYSDIFDAYFRCDGVIKMYHGNCNTRIPE